MPKTKSTKLRVSTVHAGCDETILYFDPEMAEMGNPDGAVYGRMLFVAAATPSGRRFIHQRAFETDEDEAAERLASRVRETGEINLDHWVETYEVYGSDAWIEADFQRQVAHESDPNKRGTVRDF